MDNSNKYTQLKQLGFSLLKINENGNIILYENNWLIKLIIISILFEALKHGYFSSIPIKFEYGLLYGNIIVSELSDQRFFNLINFCGFTVTLIYFYFYIFKNQRIYFYELSKFLIILDPKEFSRKFNVRSIFSKDFLKELKFLAKLNNIIVYFYSLSIVSFYLTGIVQLLNLGFKLEQILKITLPSIIIGSLAFTFYFIISISSFSFSLLYIKLLTAKVNKLRIQLDQFNFKLSDHQIENKMIKHLFRLNIIIKDFKMSQNYFEKVLIILLTPVFLCFFTFPTIIIISKNYLTNRLIPLFFLDLNYVVMPIVRSNENFKKEFTTYLNSIHHFMARNKNLRLKLKLIKTFDIYQKNNELKFSLFKIIYFDMIFVPRFLIESVTVTFLLFTFTNI